MIFEYLFIFNLIIHLFIYLFIFKLIIHFQFNYDLK